MVAAHYKKDDLLNRWTSSSGISGYDADFHEGHGTIGAWHENGMDTPWARRAMYESALSVCALIRTAISRTESTELGSVG